MYPWPMCHTGVHTRAGSQRNCSIYGVQTCQLLQDVSSHFLTSKVWFFFFLWLLFWDNGVGGYIFLSFSVIVNVFLLNSAFDEQDGVLIPLWSAVCLLIEGLCWVHRNIKRTVLVLVTWKRSCSGWCQPFQTETLQFITVPCCICVKTQIFLSASGDCSWSTKLGYDKCVCGRCSCNTDSHWVSSAVWYVWKHHFCNAFCFIMQLCFLLQWEESYGLPQGPSITHRWDSLGNGLWSFLLIDFKLYFGSVSFISPCRNYNQGAELWKWKISGFFLVHVSEKKWKK